jgi:hypothetical protein
MIHDLWTRKQFALAAAIVSLGIVAAVLAIGLAYPEPFTDAGLGPEWQCSKVAFVFTTCRRVPHAETASIRVPHEPTCRRPRT